MDTSVKVPTAKWPAIKGFPAARSAQGRQIALRCERTAHAVLCCVRTPPTYGSGRGRARRRPCRRRCRAAAPSARRAAPAQRSSARATPEMPGAHGVQTGRNVDGPLAKRNARHCRGAQRGAPWRRVPGQQGTRGSQVGGTVLLQTREHRHGATIPEQDPTNSGGTRRSAHARGPWLRSTSTSRGAVLPSSSSSSRSRSLSAAWFTLSVFSR